MGGMCAVSALCALWVGLRGAGASSGVLHFGPERCRPSSAGGGFVVDKAEGEQLFESQVDSLFTHVAME
jgi:hypothetical protein